MKKFCLLLLVGTCLIAFAMAWKPGQIVCARWSGTYYLATVTAANGDQWDVIYADGDHAMLAESDLHELPGDPGLKAGDKVLAIWNNGAKFYSGVVEDVCQLSYLVKWDDGSTPSWVPAGKILRHFEVENP
ncbi:MAG: hypothetical protein JXQ27_05105 [Acidobacteria bacterium]|nr:hypothetical protein [Acidobacteriota bacterium]